MKHHLYRFIEYFQIWRLKKWPHGTSGYSSALSPNVRAVTSIFSLPCVGFGDGGACVFPRDGCTETV